MSSLKGIRVLDASQIMAGPYCTMVLADMGAEIIKIEKMNGGDDSRQMGPFVNGESTCFFQINRNKKSIALNLKTEEGKEIFYRLASNSDVFVENFRPGVTQSLGINYEKLKKINPGLIYCSISGYGQTGPDANKGGFDLVAQGLSGIMSMTGEPEGRPLKSGVAIYDIGAGLTAAYSVLAAYIHKQNTGKGQHLDISLAEVGLPWFAWESAAYFAEGTLPKATGSRHRVSAPYQAFRTKDGYMILGCANQRTWEKFCTHVVEKQEWIEDPRFKTNSDRETNVDELEVLIERIFSTEKASHWIKKCEKAGVPAGPINNFEEAVNNPHYHERQMVQEMVHPVIGKMKTIATPTKFSLTPISLNTPAPRLGQHTDEILSKLELKTKSIEDLRKRRIVN